SRSVTRLKGPSCRDWRRVRTRDARILPRGGVNSHFRGQLRIQNRLRANGRPSYSILWLVSRQDQQLWRFRQSGARDDHSWHLARLDLEDLTRVMEETLQRVGREVVHG